MPSPWCKQRFIGGPKIIATFWQWSEQQILNVWLEFFLWVLTFDPWRLDVNHDDRIFNMQWSLKKFFYTLDNIIKMMLEMKKMLTKRRKKFLMGNFVMGPWPWIKYKTNDARNPTDRHFNEPIKIKSNLCIAPAVY